ncbi:LON peptidase substrate-binding domain-containing protein [Hellea sp.]|nr:LON peptidase substrate-binding domain-containing protein [Hellea sp.]
MSAHYKSLTRRTNPAQLAIFPLNGAVLLPACDLPLNIFEPRYLNMIDDALKGDRLIGMVQKQNGRLAKIGGLGRITQFSESDDGRYLIVLKGLKRFSISEEANVKTPYRQAKINFDGFESDADIHNASQTSEALSGKTGERTTLTVAMKALAKTLGVQIDWEGLNEIPLPVLINQAAMISPFAAEDKQSLLEAVSTDERRKLLIGLMHLYANKDMGQNPDQVQQ